MKRFFAVICLLIASPVLGNTPPVVSNVTAIQRAHTALIDVTYDLADADGDAVQISIWYSIDGGVSWGQECLTVSGDVGAGIVPTTGLTVTWDAGVDYPDFINSQFALRVYADDGNSLDLPFPNSADQLMANFRTVYENQQTANFPNLLHPDHLTLLQQSTQELYPDVGPTVDRTEEIRMHERMFAGGPVTDPEGMLVPGVSNIEFMFFAELAPWTIAPATSVFPYAEYAPFACNFRFDRPGFSSLTVQGNVIFYVTHRDSLHNGVIQQYYQMLGQQDLTNGKSAAVEATNWGTVKVLFR